MGELLSTVIPLSLGAAVSPTVLVLIIVVLGGKTAPRARAALITLGMAIMLVFIGLAAGSLTQEVKTGGSGWILAWVDIGLGLLLLGIGIKKLAAKPKPEAAPSRYAGKAGAGVRPLRFLVVGFIAMATDFSSIVLFVPAIKNITATSLDVTVKVLVSLIPYLAVLLPAAVPLAASIIAPEKTGKVLAGIHGWLGRHDRIISVSLAFVFGVYLLYKGLSGLS